MENDDPEIEIISWLINKTYPEYNVEITAQSLYDVGHMKLFKDAYNNMNWNQWDAADILWFGNKWPLVASIYLNIN